MVMLFNYILTRRKFLSFSLLRVSGMILALISNIFIVRRLSVDDFGIFSVALLVVNLITTVVFSWSSSSILYFGSKEKEKYRRINKTVWARNIIIFISLVVATLAIVLLRNQIDDYIGINIWFL